MRVFSVVPEEHWMGAQHDAKEPDASFFVEPSGKNSFDLFCRNGLQRVSEQQKQRFSPCLPSQDTEGTDGVKWDLTKKNTVSESRINLEQKYVFQRCYLTRVFWFSAVRDGDNPAFIQTAYV